MMTRCCWPECPSQGLRPDLPLCDQHFTHVGTRFIDERTLAGPMYRAVLERTEQERREKLLADEIRRGQFATEERARVAARSVVYYVRTGRYIKGDVGRDKPKVRNAGGRR